VTKTRGPAEDGGLANRKEKADAAGFSQGALPYIVDEAESIADSTFIRAHIEGKYGFDSTRPSILQQRAQAWAFERMIEQPPLLHWLERAGSMLRPLQRAAHSRCGSRASPRKTREDAQFRVAEN